MPDRGCQRDQVVPRFEHQPRALGRTATGSFAIPVAVCAAGVLLVALAVRLARWRTGHASARERGSARVRHRISGEIAESDQTRGQRTQAGAIAAVGIQHPLPG